ncbi:hypothetical protein GSI_11552 [Ganoderma sinense ZZ0214-1]|uniref:NADH:flavin oxidoreductase/NADH oxidase N-terminal domain-containing protein n=1 Tax=Ganoderma sinense ZZ0214-1 TaxID=1077348 RepID=A0A2G8RWB4_9APHY|nr:hypothetical protein GSI_11552 [Ganoderma sinense ZZ0214-1]
MGESSETSTDAQLRKLFQPIKVGDVTLAHRVVFAPMTRLRANTRGVHGDLAVEYYAQRASVPGSLLISEATYVSRQAEGRSPNAPGVWNEEQIAGWKRVVDAVHAKGSYIYMQLWALGRAARLGYIRERDPDYAYVAASDVPLAGRDEVPRPLTVEEIKEYVAAFAQAAWNAVFGAGFDGVEIHGANGYLVDQFTQDVSNTRTDEYGGSVENRCRFALEVVGAVSAAIGESKTAIRLSPWSEFQDMRMADPVPTFTHLVSRLAKDHTNLAYLHVIEPGYSGNVNTEMKTGESNAFIREIWLPRPLVSAGGYIRESALRVAEETGQLIAFGRPYISNPDLPLRLRKDILLAEWEQDTFYTPGESRGYTDYPFAGGGGGLSER